jgi:hypothetical protein
MRKYLLAAIFSVVALPAYAQCTGVFPNQTVCGNAGTGAGQPSPTPFSSFAATVGGANNVSGSDQEWLGAINSGSNILTIGVTTDFKVGQGIWVPNAGPSNTAAVPTTGSVTVTCVSSCSQTITYKLVGRDANQGYSAASSAMTAASSAARVNLLYSRDAAKAQNNKITFTCGANDVDVAIYAATSTNGGDTLGLIGISPCSDGVFYDYNQLNAPENAFAANGPAARDLPDLTPPAAAGAAPLLTKVNAIAAGGVLTLNTNASNTVLSGSPVFHDDGVALQALLTTACAITGPNTTHNEVITLAAGVYNTHQTLQCLPPVTLGNIQLLGQGGTVSGTGAAFGWGTQLVYYGRGDKPLFYTNGLNDSAINDIVFNGNGYAHYVVQLDNSDALHPSSGNHFMRDRFVYANSSTTGVLFAANNPACSGPGAQVSELWFVDDYFVGRTAPGSNWAGFSAFCGGNTANFNFLNVAFLTTQLGATPGAVAASNGQATGNWSFTNVVTGNIADTVFNGLGSNSFNLISLEGENVDASRLVTGGLGCSMNIQDVKWGTRPPQGGDHLIEAGGCAVHIFGSLLGQGINNPVTGEYGIGTGQTEPTNTNNNGSVSSIVSIGNTYSGSTSQPFFIGATRLSLTGPPMSVCGTAGCIQKIMTIISHGDFGPQPGTANIFPDINWGAGTMLGDAAIFRQYFTNGPVDSTPHPTTALDVYGSGHMFKIADPPAPTVVVNSGSGTSTTYKIAFRSYTGATTLMSSGTTVSGGATPNNTINTSGTGVSAGTWYMDIIDDTGGQHKIIGTVNTTQSANANFVFVDNNATRNSYTVPTRNNTGDFTVDGNGTMTGTSTLTGQVMMAAHVNGSTTTPVANSCTGFSLGTGSSDIAGHLTYTSATTCSVNFGVAFANAPTCVISPGSAASTVEVTTSTTGFAATFGTAQTALSWLCFGS